ncbi:hypothetical protein IAR50_000040 [Cryptococcus sp. DSM 104548]
MPRVPTPTRLPSSLSFLIQNFPKPSTRAKTIDLELNTHLSAHDDQGRMRTPPVLEEEGQRMEETDTPIAVSETQQHVFDEAGEEADDEGMGGSNNEEDDDGDLSDSSQLERRDD